MLLTMMNEDEFYPPPEAPVFEPNEEEFADPLGYIAKIRPIAEKAGICKVRPPPYWQPPFAIDVENFKFVPRIQRLNELGIQTRIRLQFIQKLAKFWELQGIAFRLPHVAGRPMDLYGLHQAVKNVGGFAEVCKNRQWNAICPKLGLAKNFSATIKQNYEKILYPYDIMMSGCLLESIDSSDKPLSSKVSSRYGQSDKTKDEQMVEDVDNTKQRNKRKIKKEPLLADSSNNKELAKLHLFGAAGPKMLGLGLTAKRKNLAKSGEMTSTSAKREILKNQAPSKVKTEPEEDFKNKFDHMEREWKNTEQRIDNKVELKTSSVGRKISTRKKGSEQIPYSIINGDDDCKICLTDQNDSQLLLCDGCDDSYHTYCLIPPLQSIPKGDWRCPKCLSKECNKKADAYGFEQARKEYTLQSFGEMADSFKSEYFTKPAHMIPTELVEKEFWRLIDSIEEDVAVEYGADIHVLDHGSGFPRLCDEKNHPLSSEEEEYATSGWNLNNLPVDKQSLLKCMTGDISGMNVPWVYVGMCFSAFCWHIEDHWTYSINYLHWGEPKTWYGVPREDATKLERVMQNTAPDMFEQHPDVLHHLVTTINPSTLMKNGVRVVRTNQCAGEFIITFPRAYHAGFNQGYNFAEAVNFGPADWVPIGRQSVAHYRTVGRPCVFSHEEMICKVASNPELLDVQLAAAVYKDMIVLIKEEEECRKQLQKLGVTQEQREAFELVPDDERQCYLCKTTCFLSAVTCPCRMERFACTHHISELCETCKPSQLILRYKYTLGELPPMLHKVKRRAESFDTWCTQLEDAFGRKENKLSLLELKDLLAGAMQGKFPKNEKLHQLQSAIQEAEKCSKLAQQLITARKRRTRHNDLSSATGVPAQPGSCLLSLSEIRAFHEQLLGLPCLVPNLDQVSDFISRIEHFIVQADSILQEKEPSSKRIEALIEDSLDFDLNLPQVSPLHHALQQAKWLEDVRSCLLLGGDQIESDASPNFVSLGDLRKLIDSGVSVAPRPAVERAMAELQEVLNLSETLEERAKCFVQSIEKGSLKDAEVITLESKKMPVRLPHCAQLQVMVKNANAWIARLQGIQSRDCYPYLEVLEAMLLQADSMELKLSPSSVLTAQVEAAQQWKEQTSKAFLERNSLFSLLEVLSPRTHKRESSISLKYMRRKMKESQAERQQMIEKWAKADNFNADNPEDPAHVVSNFKALGEEERANITGLRRKNSTKNASISENSKAVTDSVLYCVCRKPSSGVMLQCELCRDWFHKSCVTPIRFQDERSRRQQAYELKFLCPLCCGSRRPRLEVVLSLLLQLQKIPVRIKEGEALQCLTERAIGWQGRVRKVLNKPKYVSMINHLDKRLKENENIWQRRKTQQFDRVSSSFEGHSTLKPASVTSKRMSSLESIDHTIDSVLQKTLCQEPKGLSGVDALLSAASKTCPGQEDMMEAAEVLAMFASSSAQNQHVGNDAPKQGDEREMTAVITGTNEDSSPTASDDLRKIFNDENWEHDFDPLPEKKCMKRSHTSAKAQILSKRPLISLPGDMKITLEELMMEGDLLEVTLNETQQIWKILQASRPLNVDRFQELCEYDENKEFKPSNKRQYERKRKREEHPSGGAGEKKNKRKSSTDKSMKAKIDGSKQSALDALAAFDDDDYALCAIGEATVGAVACKQPTGEVDWLQCDGGCEAWFHCVCVSVTAEQARKLDYICEKCLPKKDTRDGSSFAVAKRSSHGDVEVM